MANINAIVDAQLGLPTAYSSLHGTLLVNKKDDSHRHIGQETAKFSPRDRPDCVMDRQDPKATNVQNMEYGILIFSISIVLTKHNGRWACRK